MAKVNRNSGFKAGADKRRIGAVIQQLTAMIAELRQKNELLLAALLKQLEAGERCVK